MNGEELLALSGPVGYLAVVGFASFFVIRSILSDVDPKRLLDGRPFLFLRVALGALLCTWYYNYQFFVWSWNRYAKAESVPRLGQWLVQTSLFEEIWSTVCSGPSNWWWSSLVCTWTVVFAAVLWVESGRRGIKYPWAFMILAQLVASSVATPLFIAALAVHPRISSDPSKVPVRLWLPQVLALVTIYLVPQFVGTERFLNNILWMHGLLIVPLLTTLERGIIDIPLSVIYPFLTVIASAIHIRNTFQLYRLRDQAVLSQLYWTVFSNPAQTSFSLDVIWVVITLALWSLTTGSTISMGVKSAAATITALAFMTSQTGINWTWAGGLVAIGIVAVIGAASFGLQRLRRKNGERRQTLLESMGIMENSVIAGTDKRPPSKSGRRIIVGFWHPYCNAGGGGERVLWSAIAYIQVHHPDVVVLVYSGDFPAASTSEIITKVKDRFSIDLSPSTIAFIPLPSRELISDDYWSHFTLLGQSVGSLILAWEGLCGADGLWGDIFLDSMGYAFIFPFVRLIAGREVATGAYIHYPTVSADMVKRVRKRSAGVENGGASSSWLRTQVKLLYYRMFTSLYANSLLFSDHVSTNSSWTQAHVKSLLIVGRASFLARLLLLIKKPSSRTKDEERTDCEVVYPPCDTAALVKLGNLNGRKREIVSLAQFRPEKEHSKQLHAIARLFTKHPEYRSGSSRVTLTMMGGARHPADEQRVESLRSLSRELGVQASPIDNVEFLLNAPYPEIVRRLGQASIGLNTMQDEHFGINVVEFMAAGLIPIVHASAGPVMDIVVPHNGQRTGFHANTAEEFAESIHEAISLSESHAEAMRRAARSAAVDKFSLEEFERGFERGWQVLVR
ncbi:MAG: asparagine-linked glycosylation protein, partial [Tremellales sp. Tagirdzhanova-0007]